MSGNTGVNLSHLPKLVAVHPLVLLSVVDHFNRVAKSSKNKRVVGVLLGQKSQGKADVTNCYAIPFDEDPKQPNIWFVDHIYHESMFIMFKKVNAREKVLGWYTTGKNFKYHDIQINQVFKKYCSNPILLIVDVQHEDKLALPTEAYCAIDEVTDKIQALKGMMGKIQQIKLYIEAVISGKVQANNDILYKVQEILNLIPNLNNPEIVKSFASKNNDQMFVLYVCSLSKSIISLHSLINNKLQNKEAELEKQKEAEKKMDEKKEGNVSGGNVAVGQEKKEEKK